MIPFPADPGGHGAAVHATLCTPKTRRSGSTVNSCTLQLGKHRHHITMVSILSTAQQYPATGSCATDTPNSQSLHPFHRLHGLCKTKAVIFQQSLFLDRQGWYFTVFFWKQQKRSLPKMKFSCRNPHQMGICGTGKLRPWFRRFFMCNCHKNWKIQGRKR